MPIQIDYATRFSATRNSQGADFAQGSPTIRETGRTPQGAGAVVGPAADGTGQSGSVDLNSITSADDLKAIEALDGAGGIVRIGINQWRHQSIEGTAFIRV